MSAAEDSGFLSRWSRRKVQARQGVAIEEPPASDPLATVPVVPAAEPASPLPAQSVDTTARPADANEPAKPAPPTMADVATLTRESDFSRFVAPNVDGEVKNAALRKLFANPHFNVMDGLDTYVDDYSKPDPLPLSSVRKMAQAAFLGLIESTPPAPEAVPTSTAQAPKSAEVKAAESGAATPEPDENADLRLQSHDAAGCGGAEDGAAADPERQH